MGPACRGRDGQSLGHCGQAGQRDGRVLGGVVLKGADGNPGGGGGCSVLAGRGRAHKEPLLELKKRESG